MLRSSPTSRRAPRARPSAAGSATFRRTFRRYAARSSDRLSSSSGTRTSSAARPSPSVEPCEARLFQMEEDEPDGRSDDGRDNRTAEKLRVRYAVIEKNVAK